MPRKGPLCKRRNGRKSLWGATFGAGEVLSLLRPGTIGVNAALNLCNAFLVSVNHSEDRDDSADKNCNDGNQEDSQPEDRVNQPIHSLIPPEARCRV